VGSLDGTIVEGSAVGVVGVWVGGTLGFDGAAVGILVGVAVGNLDGTYVGLHVGPLGTVVGVAVGPTAQYRIPYPSPTFIPVREDMSTPLA
jgi:hypothetical protein